MRTYDNLYAGGRHHRRVRIEPDTNRSVTKIHFDGFSSGDRVDFCNMIQIDGTWPESDDAFVLELLGRGIQFGRLEAIAELGGAIGTVKNIMDS